MSKSIYRVLRPYIPEFDCVEREANIILFTRPVKGVPNLMKLKAEPYQHWALVFHFPQDGTWITLEGLADENNKLSPRYTKQSPREEGRQFLVGRVTTSLSLLREYADNNPSNGKPYGLGLENCQEWVRNVAKNFGPTIVEKLNEVHALKEDHYWIPHVIDKALGNRPLCCKL